MFSCLSIFCPSKLHRALLDENSAQALELIKSTKNINFYENGHTPLQLSLVSINDMSKCDFALLDAQADPNLPYNTKDNHHKTLQPHVSGGNLSKVKLLALYGATPEGVGFPEPAVKKIIEDQNLIYKKRVLLENKLIDNLDSKEKLSILQQLQDLWKNEADKETDAPYKTQYQKKADAYQNLINKYNTAVNEEDDYKEDSANDQNENTWLLKKNV